MSRAFRYNLILVLVALGTTLAAVAGWRFARASAPVSGPIVLVSIDSLRADALPAYGSKKVQTPALDALAADGVVFDRAYAHAPLTLPAHVALLSGRLPTETGVRDNVGASVPESLRLLSSMLADRGYATGGVVSSYALRKATGISNGFTFFDDELQPAESAGPAPSREAATAEHQGAAGAAPEAPIVSRDGAESERRAERWLSGTGSARAFLFLHLDEPHAPYTPPDAFAHVGAYEGEVAYADDLVGRLVAYLKKQQLYDESTIIVVGDHGESLGAHGEPEHGLLVLDDTVRVPLIIKRAGAEGRGTRIGELVQHVDIVPTILDLVNAPVPGGLSGRSLRPLFAGVSLGPRVAYSESVFPATQFGWTAQRTVTDGRFRYVSGPTPQLFDLEQDPESRTNISASHPEDVARLAKALESFEATKVLPDAKPPAVDDRLLSLGFIGPRLFARLAFDDPTDLPPDAGALAQAFAGAMRAYAERRWTPALDQLRTLVRTSPERLDLWASLARVGERAQRYDIAADAWRHIVATGADPVAVAAATRPTEPATMATAREARVNLAWTLLRARRPDEGRLQAEAVLEQLQAAEPNGPDAEALIALRTRAYEVLARAALTRREPGLARVHAQHIADLDPSSPMPLFVEGRQLFDQARYADALDLLDKAAAVAKDRTVFDLEFWRGEALMKLTRPSEAEEAYLAELRRTPDNTRAFTSLATLYHGQGRAEETAALITRYTQSIRTGEAYDTAVRLLTGFGERERADLLKTEAARLFPAVATPALTQQ